MKKIKAIRGMRDIVYPESARWDRIVSIALDIFKSRGFRSLYLPAAEYTSLFSRTIGEETDIVSKEMYSFKDKKGRDLTLRPEGTAGAVRAMIENRMLEGRVREKILYFGPMFRYEKPQSGRYRQFYQLGCEVFGSSSVYADAEITMLAAEILNSTGVEEFNIKVNSIGCQQCRERYRKELKKFLSSRSGNLCEDCIRRIDTNILRVLDCKKKECRAQMEDIPSMTDYRCSGCSSFFNRYLEIIKGKNINFTEDPSLVRGLDYYTGVVFEIESGGDIVLAGGRYDNLVSELGGGDVPACGWALGLDRLAEKSNIRPEKIPFLYIAIVEGGKIEAAEVLADNLRSRGIWVEIDCEDESPGKKFKIADRRSVPFVGLIGGREMETMSVALKDMKSGEQKLYSLDDIEGIIKYLKC